MDFFKFLFLQILNSRDELSMHRIHPSFASDILKYILLVLRKSWLSLLWGMGCIFVWNAIDVRLNSQSTEDSLDVKESHEPIYDKPFTHHHHPSDSEQERPSSTTPPPYPTTSPPNGELPSRDQLVKPSMLRKNRGSNAGIHTPLLVFHSLTYHLLCSWSEISVYI